MRRRHFPPERNHLDAHLTLFHALPEAPLDAWELPDGPLAATVSELWFMGGGVAYRVDCPPLVRWRATIAEGYALTRQDAQWSQPHVTVQNKVPPETARALYEQLSAGFEPFGCEVVGIATWHYRGGPWEPAGRRDL